jgi:hypothetical protein
MDRALRVQTTIRVASGLLFRLIDFGMPAKAWVVYDPNNELRLLLQCDVAFSSSFPTTSQLNR